MYYTTNNLDWLDVCLPLAETVQIEQYKATEEEISNFFDLETETKYES